MNLNKAWERIIERSEVDPITNCWICSYSKNVGGGYPRVSVGGKSIKTHRISYLINKGEIPDGLIVKHLCNRKSCVNPDHIEADTLKQNTIDAYRDGLIRSDRPRLSDKQVEEIRSNKLQTYEQLVDYYKVSYMTIWRLKNYRTRM